MISLFSLLLGGCKRQPSERQTKPKESKPVVEAEPPEFMLNSKPISVADLSSLKIFCETDIESEKSGNKKVVEIASLSVVLTGDVIETVISYRDPSKNNELEDSRRTFWREGSFSRYAEIREVIYHLGASGLSGNQVRYLVLGSNVYGPHKFTDCSPQTAAAGGVGTP
jgi:hypothetical protein